MTHASRALLPFALSAVASAQTFIVDASNGAGTHFLDLPPAIAAVPDGAVLHVRAGVYSAFTVANKSLTIVGDSRTSVRAAKATLGPLAAGQKVVLKEMSLVPASVGPSLAIQGVRGHAHAESIIVRGDPLSAQLGGFTVTVAGSSDVHLHGVVGDALLPGSARIAGSCVELHACQFVGSRPQAANLPGYPALQVTDSRVVATGTTLTGGDGGTDLFTTFSPGGAGLDAARSEVHLGRGNVFTGGRGGIDPTGLGCWQVFASGGPGLRLTASTARAMDTTLIGGCGPGSLCTSCVNRAAPVLADGSSSFTTPPGVAPRAVLQGVPIRGWAVDLVLDAGPNEVALLAFGFAPACVPWPDLVGFAGILALPEIVVPPLVTSSTGTASYRLPLPLDFVLDRMIWAQFFTFPGFALPGLGSNTVTILARS